MATAEAALTPDSINEIRALFEKPGIPKVSPKDEIRSAFSVQSESPTNVDFEKNESVKSFVPAEAMNADGNNSDERKSLDAFVVNESDERKPIDAFMVDGKDELPKPKNMMEFITKKAGKVFGIPEDVPVPTAEQISKSGHPVLGATVATLNEGVIPALSEGVNQFLMNYPKALAKKAGLDLPEATTGPGKTLQTASGLVGGIKNPIFKLLGIGPASSVKKLVGAGAAYGAVSAPTNDVVGVPERIGQAALGAAIPFGVSVAGKAVTSAPDALKGGSYRVINSMIKPLLKDFSYGKNPGAGVAREGIVASNLDELASKIEQARIAQGEKIGEVINNPKYANAVADYGDALAPLREAVVKASNSPRTNSAVIQRLEDVTKDILRVVENPITGEVVSLRSLSNLTPAEATQLKMEIGDLARWTGNASDDKIVNKAIKQVYGGIKERINKIVPELEGMNEHYANLKSAEVATKYRDKIASRHNLVGLVPKMAEYGGAITGLATGNPHLFLSSIAAIGIDKALSSPSVKSRVAAGLFKMGDSELAQVFQSLPKLKDFGWKMFQAVQGKGGKDDIAIVQDAQKLLAAPETGQPRLGFNPKKGPERGFTHRAAPYEPDFTMRPRMDSDVPQNRTLPAPQRVAGLLPRPSGMIKETQAIGSGRRTEPFVYKRLGRTVKSKKK